VLGRLRQACFHSSLLPADLLPATDGSPTHDEKDGIEKTAMTYAEGLKRIQAKRVQSTKLRRVLRVVKVTPVHDFADTVQALNNLEYSHFY